MPFGPADVTGSKTIQLMVIMIALVGGTILILNFLAGTEVVTLEEGDVISIGQANMSVVIYEKRMEPPKLGWFYVLEVTDITEDTMKIDLTFYDTGQEKETGPVTLREGTPLEFTKIKLTLLNTDYREARLRIKRKVLGQD